MLKGGECLYQVTDFTEINILEHIAITKHAKDRLVERDIKVDDIRQCINTGEIIKQYEDDKPLPSCLILGKSMNDNYMHIVVSRSEDFIYLITAYFPDSSQWETDLKTRKER